MYYTYYITDNQNIKQAAIADNVMVKVFESAAKLQKLVPNAVLVGGSAVSAHIAHRYSVDHDHVVDDLNTRFDIILDTISKENWIQYKAIQNKIILGELDGIQAGIRQLKRSVPLEVEKMQLNSGNVITVPTYEEILRVKAYYIVNRNQVRDYLDVAALIDQLGYKKSAEILLKIDNYYDDINQYSTKISTELVQRLANPEPKDSRSITEIENYKGVRDKYKNWSNILEICRNTAKEMIKNAQI